MRVRKVRDMVALLPTLQDPHAEYSILRHCLALPKVMYSLRTVDTSGDIATLHTFDSLMREVLSRILGAPLQWSQAQLPMAMGGLGLRSARGHAPGAYCTSFLASQPLVTQMLAVPEEQPPRPLPPAALTLLAARMDEEVAQEEIAGLNQWEVSARVDAANQTAFSNLIQAAGVRESARMASLSLPHAGAWLFCPPSKGLCLHLSPRQFVVAARFRLGMAVYDVAGPCPACGRHSDVHGDHGLCCGTGGEMISRHSALQGAIYDTAAAAGCAPQKEARHLITDSGRRPADILIPRWVAGKAAALDVTVTHPLKAATVARAAVTPGHAMAVAYDAKMAGAFHLCRQENITFIPIVAESLGGWHPAATAEFRKLGSLLARHTGVPETQAIAHLVNKMSVMLMQSLGDMISARVPTHPRPDIAGSY